MKCWNPECSNELSPRAVSCPLCGWDRPEKRGNAVDPHWWQCANVREGQRCANPGSLSRSTRGGGPWYCRQHFFPQDIPRGAPRPNILPLPLDAEAALERAAIRGEGN